MRHGVMILVLACLLAGGSPAKVSQLRTGSLTPGTTKMLPLALRYRQRVDQAIQMPPQEITCTLATLNVSPESSGPEVANPSTAAHPGRSLLLELRRLLV